MSLLDEQDEVEEVRKKKRPRKGEDGDCKGDEMGTREVLFTKQDGRLKIEF